MIFTDAILIPSQKMQRQIGRRKLIYLIFQTYNKQSRESNLFE